MTGMDTGLLSRLQANVQASDQPETIPAAADALRVLTDESLAPEHLLQLAAIPRERHFGRGVQIHILNNVRNGYCPEDSGYSAQRREEKAGPIPSYAAKTDEEVFAEARRAFESGAYRYCMVTAGRGPNKKSVERFATLIKRIKTDFPGLQLCLSAGILKDPALAEQLSEAGLDRYNHNLNTSREHYGDIASTHTYEDRIDTLSTMRGAGVSLCSGVIVGMGESPADLVSVALDLRKHRVPSIPVNFFLPVPGHAVRDISKLTPDYCLRALAMFRLTNPDAEIRMAAGRELHLKGLQGQALQAASSLFVSGYLNVQGSDAADTIRMIYESGYEVDAANSDFPAELERLLEAAGLEQRELAMKDLSQLRPFQKS